MEINAKNGYSIAAYDGPIICQPEEMVAVASLKINDAEERFLEWVKLDGTNKISDGNIVVEFESEEDAAATWKATMATEDADTGEHWIEHPIAFSITRV